MFACLPIAHVQVLADRLKATKLVTVVGGGPLGLELAGEILTVSGLHLPRLYHP